MNITEQRVAIYKAETAIEAVLDELRKEAKLNADSIVIQTLFDEDTYEAPALKVNIVVSKLKP